MVAHYDDSRTFLLLPSLPPSPPFGNQIDKEEHATLSQYLRDKQTIRVIDDKPVSQAKIDRMLEEEEDGGRRMRTTRTTRATRGRIAGARAVVGAGVEGMGLMIVMEVAVVPRWWRRVTWRK